MGLLSDLISLGFDTEEIEIYEKKKSSDRTEESAAVVVEKKEEDFLFSKKYECPCCGETFTMPSIRAGKIRPVSQDDDLRPVYEHIDPLKYDAIVCPFCGYGALSKNFKTMMPVQRKKLKEFITPKFKGLAPAGETLTYDEAILRYKLVLLCDIVGLGKSSRKAYTSLKLAWVIRGKLEHMDEAPGEEKLQEEDKQKLLEEKKKLQEEEQECIQNAYEGFRMAFSSEGFPMCGMDEVTISYLTAVLAFKLGKYKEALQYLGSIVVNSQASSRIKGKALDLKDQIKEQVKEQAREQAKTES